MTAPRQLKLNADWHRAHRMPPNATLEQRIRWHTDHSLHCSCRPMPQSILDAIRSGAAGGKKPETKPRARK